MEIARRLDLGAACASGRARPVRRPSSSQLPRKLRNVLRRDPLGRGRDDARLDQPARGEDLPRLLRRRIGDEGAAIALGAHQPFEGEHLQGGARHRAADVEQRADLGLRELGAGRQPAVDDRIAQAGRGSPARDLRSVRLARRSLVRLAFIAETLVTAARISAFVHKAKAIAST